MGTVARPRVVTKDALDTEGLPRAGPGRSERDRRCSDAEAAERTSERWPGRLEAKHPGAAASTLEGLEETLTVTRLGLTPSLRHVGRKVCPPPVPAELRRGQPEDRPVDVRERVADGSRALHGPGERLGDGVLGDLPPAASEAVRRPPERRSGLPE